MTVTDGDRYAIAMAKLSQARSAVYEATRIIEHLFGSDGPKQECGILHYGTPSNSSDHDDCDPITGLYEGQIATQAEEGPEEGSECED